MKLDSLTVYIISTGEDTYDECLSSLENQDCSFRIEHIHDVYPMSKAFQTMPDQCKTKYFVQVDADMILKEFAIRELFEAGEKTGLFTPIVYGQLYEEEFGVGGSVRLWKRDLFRFFSFRDRRTVDRDLFRRIRRFGFRRKNLKKILGIHRPRHSEFSRYLKAKSDVEKWRYLGRKPKLYALPELEKALNAHPKDKLKLLGLLMGVLTDWKTVRGAKNIAMEKDRFRSLMNVLDQNGSLSNIKHLPIGGFKGFANYFSNSYMEKNDSFSQAKSSICRLIIDIYSQDKRQSQSERELYKVAIESK
jgi:hypothetical protein